MELLLENNIREIYQIIAECNYEIIIIESSDSEEEKKESDKKDTIKEKVKRMWEALKSFVSKWWNAFIDMIKKNKAVILNGKKEVEYYDYSEVVKTIGNAIKLSREGGHSNDITTDVEVKKGTVKEAVKSLEKCASQLKNYIDDLKSEKDGRPLEVVNNDIKVIHKILSELNSDLKALINTANK